MTFYKAPLDTADQSTHYLWGIFIILAITLLIQICQLVVSFLINSGVQNSALNALNSVVNPFVARDNMEDNIPTTNSNIPTIGSDLGMDEGGYAGGAYNALKKEGESTSFNAKLFGSRRSDNGVNSIGNDGFVPFNKLV